MDVTTAPSQELIDEFVGACHGNVERVRALLEEYPDLTLTNASFIETPIEAATQMANHEIMEMLIANGAPIDICTAAVLSRASLVEEMLEDDPSLKDARGAHGFPVMYFPVIVGRADIAETLHRYGADLNAGEGGMTALHGAAMFGRADMVAWLLERGANPAALDFAGKTALQVAEESGNSAVAEVLRSAK